MSTTSTTDLLPAATQGVAGELAGLILARLIARAPGFTAPAPPRVRRRSPQ